MKVTVSTDADECIIAIDGLPHAHWLWKYYRGFQAYNNGVYTIEVLLKDQNLVLEYDNRELWVAVLEQI